ncbi:MAG TPA: hypothetical protein VGM90_27170 [Kofleriaceae bacterium]
MSGRGGSLTGSVNENARWSASLIEDAGSFEAVPTDAAVAGSL